MAQSKCSFCKKEYQYDAWKEKGLYCSWDCHNKSRIGTLAWNSNTAKPYNKCIDCKEMTSSTKTLRCQNCRSKFVKLNPPQKGKVHLTARGENWHKNHITRMPKEFYSRIGLMGNLKQQNSTEPTSIEKKVYDYLLLKGILFEKQKLINGRFIVDAYIPSLNLVIEADGKYWHDMDKIVKKDKAENAYLKKCGFELVRLLEKEINSGEFTERLVL
jgi:very-short-patch-repair endonuclease/DNA-directed RNA polymerase subunit RPC12/RpoP